MPLTKATQNVIAPNICTTDTAQNIFQQKTFPRLYSTTSSSSVSLGTGTKTFVVSGVTPSNLMWQTGDPIRVERASTRWMTGTVTSFTPATNTIVINVTTTSSGTGQIYNDWKITYNGQLNKSIVHHGDGEPFTVLDTNNTTLSQIKANGSIMSQAIEAPQGGDLRDVRLGGLKSYYGFWAFISPLEEVIINPVLLNDNSCYEVWVKVYFQTINSTTFVYTHDVGLYRDVFVVRNIENAQFYSGYQINAVASNSLFPIFTSVGRAVSAGGWSASRYPCAFRATQPTTSADGTFSMEIKGHSTADTATLSYASFISVSIIEVAWQA